ncbi:hypothetical protein CFP56_006026 [Quercus suber]|uniref:Uncharacterized protein n=1 Tax=Quercus suber TaxID=58331 RepID=A0AAW0M9K2_QUESU
MGCSICTRLTRPRPELSVGLGSGKFGVERKNMSPSEYLSLPRESMMKEKLEVKLATFPEFLSQRCICSEYVARPQLSTSSGVWEAQNLRDHTNSGSNTRLLLICLAMLAWLPECHLRSLSKSIGNLPTWHEGSHAGPNVMIIDSTYM